MNKILKFSAGFAVGIGLTVAVIATASQAGLFGSAVTSGWPTVESEPFKVEAHRFDFRAYIFSPPEHPEITCIALAGESKAGLSCLK